MSTFEEYLTMKFWGNSVKAYLMALGVFLLVSLGLYLFERIILRQVHALAKRSNNKWDDYVATVIENTRTWFFLLMGLFVASRSLKMTPEIKRYSYVLGITLFLIQTAIWGKTLIEAYTKRYRRIRLETDAASVTTMAAVGFLMKLALYSVILIMILDNAGVDITALVAGLGIGGIAVGLAAQNVLGDLFASLAIVLDKPFVIGDFIIVDDILGNIKNIGIKTTRISSLGGEEIIVSNSDLMKSRIRNYKRMNERRILFSVGVVYQTSAEQLKKIPKIIRETVESTEKTRFDRAHFSSYGDSSLNFEIVYYVLSPDYNIYMDIQQTINMKLFEKFVDEKIEFAYPTRTLYVEHSGSSPAEVAAGLRPNPENQ